MKHKSGKRNNNQICCCPNNNGKLDYWHMLKKVTIKLIMKEVLQIIMKFFMNMMSLTFL